MLKIKVKLYKKHKISNNQELDNTIETLKQKVKAQAGRLRRYDDMNNRRTQNKLFAEYQHNYRSLDNKQRNPTQIPAKKDVQNFWTEILSNPVPYKKDATWITKIEISAEEIEQHPFEEIDENIVVEAIKKKTQNWKTPGIYKIQNYYLKYLTSTHKYIAGLFDRLIKGLELIDT
ncbi:unnamed protein product [Euphydryas editha]|uniref:Reverse transcriptase n=1 Tax=Euphydryas editha TaxID=104508 RepID=A0AAU9UBK4_EUPED|nr:unnamed protein product [Euphydryas editha]